jgi:hypothetical protein
MRRLAEARDRANAASVAVADAFAANVRPIIGKWRAIVPWHCPSADGSRRQDRSRRSLERSTALSSSRREAVALGELEVRADLGEPELPSSSCNPIVIDDRSSGRGQLREIRGKGKATCRLMIPSQNCAQF